MINNLRGLIFNFFYTLSVIVYSVPLLLLFPFLSYRFRVKLFSYWPMIIQGLLRSICGIRFRVIGAENIPAQPVVVVANHQSTWETLMFYTLFQPISAVLKRELLYIPLFGWILRLTRPIVIDRSRKSSALKEILRQGRQRLESGTSVLIFPEGTRVPATETRSHFPGGAMLAVKTGYPILPVAHNAGCHWPAHKLAKIPGEIVVKIGSPISVQGRSPKELNKELENWLNQEKSRLIQ